MGYFLCEEHYFLIIWSKLFLEKLYFTFYYGSDHLPRPCEQFLVVSVDFMELPSHLTS